MPVTLAGPARSMIALLMLSTITIGPAKVTGTMSVYQYLTAKAMVKFGVTYVVYKMNVDKIESIQEY